jgi:hypothetical protein
MMPTRELGSRRRIGKAADETLLETVQRQTFRYFWDFAHPTSGLAYDRVDPGANGARGPIAVGGSGFGIMAIIVAASRRWISHAAALERMTAIVTHLENARCHHGVYPHFMDGLTGDTIAFAPQDDGGDLVETSFLFQGLLCARQYFAGDDSGERELRNRINKLWHSIEWRWHTRGRDVLYWHWSPHHGWALNYEIRGWNECLITYILAASAPEHAIDESVYHRGWASGRDFLNGGAYYGVTLPLGPSYGGYLCFAHDSFLGLDPRGLHDRYADYWDQNVAHALIQYEHCVRNPHGFRGYGRSCWGMTSGDDPDGYRGHSPTEDTGVIAPNAAIASLPYTPEHTMRVLRHFLYDLGPKIWGECGFVSAFDETRNWHATSSVAIDQGPIIAMIENYRTGLLWRLFMSCPEVQRGLRKLGFASPSLD